MTKWTKIVQIVQHALEGEDRAYSIRLYNGDDYGVLNRYSKLEDAKRYVDFIVKNKGELTQVVYEREIPND